MIRCICMYEDNYNNRCYDIFYTSGRMAIRNDGDLPKTARKFLRTATGYPTYSLCFNRHETMYYQNVEDVPKSILEYGGRKKVYKYGMRLRGFSIGCQPRRGFHERIDDDGTYGRRYHDILLYIRKLDDQELANYELDYLGEDFLE